MGKTVTVRICFKDFVFPDAKKFSFFYNIYTKIDKNNLYYEDIKNDTPEEIEEKLIKIVQRIQAEQLKKGETDVSIKFSIEGHGTPADSFVSNGFSNSQDQSYNVLNLTKPVSNIIEKSPKIRFKIDFDSCYAATSQKEPDRKSVEMSPKVKIHKNDFKLNRDKAIEEHKVKNSMLDNFLNQMSEKAQNNLTKISGMKGTRHLSPNFIKAKFSGSENSAFISIVNPEAKKRKKDVALMKKKEQKKALIELKKQKKISNLRAKKLNNKGLYGINSFDDLMIRGVNVWKAFKGEEIKAIEFNPLSKSKNELKENDNNVKNGSKTDGSEINNKLKKTQHEENAFSSLSNEYKSTQTKTNSTIKEILENESYTLEEIKNEIIELVKNEIYSKNQVIDEISDILKTAYDAKFSKASLDLIKKSLEEGDEVSQEAISDIATSLKEAGFNIEAKEIHNFLTSLQYSNISNALESADVKPVIQWQDSSETNEKEQRSYKDKKPETPNSKTLIQI